MAKQWIFRFGPFVFDGINRRLLRENDRVEFKRPKSNDVLLCLLIHPQEIISSDKILDEVWGEDEFVGEENVKVYISDIRRALGDDRQQAAYIETVYAKGYRFVADVVEEHSDSANGITPVRLSFERVFDHYRRQSFFGRQSLMEALERHATQKSGYLFVQGEAGSGKTAAAVQLCGRLKRKDLYPILYFAGERGERTSRPEVFLSHVATAICDCYDLPQRAWGSLDEERLLSEVEGLVKESGTKDEACKLVLIVDALDEALTTESSDLLDYLPFLPNNATGILFSRPSSTVSRKLQNLPIKKLTLESFREETRAAIGEFAEAEYPAYEKLLAEEQTRLLESAGENFQYMRVLAQAEREEVGLTDEALPAGLPALYREYLERTTRKLAKPARRHFIDTLQLLAILQEPVPIDHALAWLEVSRIEWPEVVDRIEALFRFGSGLTEFFHPSFRDFLLSDEFTPTEIQRDTHAKLGTKLLRRLRVTQPKDDYATRWLVHHLNAGHLDDDLFHLIQQGFLHEKRKLYPAYPAAALRDLEIAFKAAARSKNLVQLLQYHAFYQDISASHSSDWDQFLIPLKYSLGYLDDPAAAVCFIQSAEERAYTLAVVASYALQHGDRDLAEVLGREALALHELGWDQLIILGSCLSNEVLEALKFGQYTSVESLETIYSICKTCVQTDPEACFRALENVRDDVIRALTSICLLRQTVGIKTSLFENACLNLKKSLPSIAKPLLFTTASGIAQDFQFEWRESLPLLLQRLIEFSDEINPQPLIAILWPKLLKTALQDTKLSLPTWLEQSKHRMSGKNQTLTYEILRGAWLATRASSITPQALRSFESPLVKEFVALELILRAIEDNGLVEVCKLLGYIHTYSSFARIIGKSLPLVSSMRRVLLLETLSNLMKEQSSSLRVKCWLDASLESFDKSTEIAKETLLLAYREAKNGCKETSDTLPGAIESYELSSEVPGHFLSRIKEEGISYLEEFLPVVEEEPVRARILNFLILELANTKGTVPVEIMKRMARSFEFPELTASVLLTLATASRRLGDFETSEEIMRHLDDQLPRIHENYDSLRNKFDAARFWHQESILLQRIYDGSSNLPMIQHFAIQEVAPRPDAIEIGETLPICIATDLGTISTQFAAAGLLRQTLPPRKTAPPCPAHTKSIERVYIDRCERILQGLATRSYGSALEARQKRFRSVEDALNHLTQVEDALRVFKIAFAILEQLPELDSYDQVFSKKRFLKRALPRILRLNRNDRSLILERIESLPLNRFSFHSGTPEIGRLISAMAAPHITKPTPQSLSNLPFPVEYQLSDCIEFLINYSFHKKRYRVAISLLSLIPDLKERCNIETKLLKQNPPKAVQKEFVGDLRNATAKISEVDSLEGIASDIAGLEGTDEVFTELVVRICQETALPDEIGLFMRCLRKLREADMDLFREVCVSNEVKLIALGEFLARDGSESWVCEFVEWFSWLCPEMAFRVLYASEKRDGSEFDNAVRELASALRDHELTDYIKTRFEVRDLGESEATLLRSLGKQLLPLHATYLSSIGVINEFDILKATINSRDTERRKSVWQKLLAQVQSLINQGERAELLLNMLNNTVSWSQSLANEISTHFCKELYPLDAGKEFHLTEFIGLLNWSFPLEHRERLYDAIVHTFKDKWPGGHSIQGHRDLYLLLAYAASFWSRERARSTLGKHSNREARRIPSPASG